MEFLDDEMEKVEMPCHECGQKKMCTLIRFENLCQHFLCLCDECLGELKKLLTR